MSFVRLLRRIILVAIAALTVIFYSYNNRKKVNGCSLSLLKEAMEIPTTVRNDYFISPAQRKSLNDNIYRLDSVMLDTFISNHVDVDNSISKHTGKGKGTVKVAYLNAERGGNWCQLAEMIKGDEFLSDVDIWLLNEMDLGMARSGNCYTARMLAYALGLNYAFAVEFLELTPGNSHETELITEHGLVDEWALHGNAILSKWQIVDPIVVRPPGFRKLYGNDRDSWMTAGFSENRLGGRFSLFATIKYAQQDLIAISSHCQARSRKYKKYVANWKLMHNMVKSSYPQESKFILGGDLWPSFCSSMKLDYHVNSTVPMLALENGTVIERGNGTDFICSNLVRVGETLVIPGVGVKDDSEYELYMDHQIVAVELRL